METILEWLDLVDRDAWSAEIGDEFRYVVGYQVQSEQTGTVYSRYEDAFEAESDEIDIFLVDPDAQRMRTCIESLSIDMFYHRVIPLAGEALGLLAYEEHWGTPPSTYSDGYDFMSCLANYLRVKALPKPEDGHYWFSTYQKKNGKRKPMHWPRRGSLFL